MKWFRNILAIAAAVVVFLPGLALAQAEGAWGQSGTTTTTAITVVGGDVAALEDTTNSLRTDLGELQSDTADSIAAHLGRIEAAEDSIANQGYPQGASITVAASDSYDKSKADYICDGTDDNAEVLQALNDAYTGGVDNFYVKLLPGLYNFSSGVYVQQNVSIDGYGARIIAANDTMDCLMNFCQPSGGGTRRHTISGLEFIEFSHTTDSASVIIRSAPAATTFNDILIWHATQRSLIIDASYITFVGLKCEDPLSSSKANVLVRGSWNKFVGSTINGDESYCVSISGNGNTIIGSRLYKADINSSVRITGDYNSINGCLVGVGGGVKVDASGANYNSVIGNTFMAGGDSTIYVAAGAEDNVIGPNSIASTYEFIDNGTRTRHFYSALPDTVGAHSDSLDAHRARIVDLESVALTSAQIDTINATMDSLTAHLNRIKAAEDSLADHLIWLQALNDSISAHLSRIEDLEEGDGMCLGELLAADSTYRGTTLVATAGENLTFGEPCCFKSDGKLWLADADSAATMPAMAIALDSISADASGLFLSRGRIRVDAWSWTTGGIVFPSTTKRSMTQSAPDGAADQIQAVGVATDPNEILFTPYPILVEHK